MKARPCMWGGSPGCATDRVAREAYYAGAAALIGLIDMAKMIAARERTKPVTSLPAWAACQRRHPTDGRIRCNLANDHEGAHERISPKGSLLYRWATDDRSADSEAKR